MPVSSGIYLNRWRIKDMARRLKLPLGFGNRRQMLLNLFRSAGQYEEADDLIAELLATTQSWMTGYQSQMSTYKKISPWIGTWTEKGSITKSLLSAMSNRSE